MASFLFLDNIEKIEEIFKLIFQSFWKYYGIWSIYSKRANAPFSIIILHDISKAAKGAIME